ncbi:YbeD family protein [Symmachiella dynata]|uniref:DUF493 domain-containing protein n=1 Tax=Symmachiella dynata TaxID=2527995 RepID=A0A517ZRQ5_9PLAN|nr:DUF493 domain-containing protein [Symmachiella dynata]QDT49519.1 hypothetical protein Pan258_35700 [Symmachiella dynata]QDU45172.1 hypothetical protein Mal52_36620 [Symmachiella dynata]
MPDGIPTIELLESTHNFPCRYVFKIIGKNVNDFPGRVVTAMRSALEASADPPHSLRETSGGRHVSVTFEPVVRTPHQVVAAYSALHLTEDVVMIF